MERFIVSARKYRPNSFDTLIGQENIARTLKNSILRKQLAHAYLFCGPRGVGKTTTARIFAKTINCSNPTADMNPCGECESCISFAEGRSYSIHELDAASNNSVDDIRQLNDLVRIPPQVGKYSVYIIDEVHMLSQAAFNAFLKTLEEPPAHAIFILATTEKHKILPTILSRCQTFDFNRISVEDIVKNLKIIAQHEKVDIDLESLHIIAQKADGAMRDALTLFDQTVAFCGNKVAYEQVISTLNVLDYDYYLRLTDCFLNSQHSEALLIFDEILSKGFNALHFIGGLSSHFRNLLLCKDASTLKLLDLAPSVAEKYREQSTRCSLSFLYAALNITTSCEAGYKLSGNQRLHIEFALIKLCRISAMDKTTETVTEATASSKNNPSAENEIKQQKPATTSIKNLYKSAEKEISTQEELRSQELGVDEFDMERLLPIWEQMAESEKDLPNLANTLRHSKPTISDNYKIHFTVSNNAQKEWIEKKCLPRLNGFLQKSLNNKMIDLCVDVVSEDKITKKPYLPEEKASFLLKNNSELGELQKDLKLELK
ncbi:MAG: DNA polymerase III subunit gamma/tau [Rikenellaceae bacterium]|jgi:DNA polymerase-3 subunit gamma/tau